MRLILIVLLFSISVFAEKNYESFLVKVKEKKVSVITPSKKKKIVTIIVENNTFERIISEIRTETKVLKRFTLEPEGKKGANHSLTVDFSKIKKLYYVSISPPFQAVLLDPKGKDYEVP